VPIKDSLRRRLAFYRLIFHDRQAHRDQGVLQLSQLGEQIVKGGF